MSLSFRLHKQKFENELLNEMKKQLAEKEQQLQESKSIIEGYKTFIDDLLATSETLKNENKTFRKVIENNNNMVIATSIPRKPSVFFNDKERGNN